MTTENHEHNIRHAQKHERGIPWRDIPYGSFEGALYAWVGDPPAHSSRMEKGIYIKTCNALVSPNGTTWECGPSVEGPWHVVGYRPVKLQIEDADLLDWASANWHQIVVVDTCTDLRQALKDARAAIEGEKK